MTGHELNVHLGKDIIARLVLVNDEIQMHYSADWQQKGHSVSPHLPLNDSIPPLNVQRFVRNLLPEGSGLEELIGAFHLSKYNTFGLIHALGEDTPGSLVILSPDKPYPPPTTFRPLAEAELAQRLDKRDEFGLVIWDGKPRLSVAGVQDKLNIVFNNKNQIGFGEGALCSTHILKFEKQKLSHLVLNEYISMQLAKQSGLNVANVDLMRIGNHPALLVERFDRQLNPANDVMRRHIIDGCQALNLPPDYKYERNFGSARDVAHIRDGASLKLLFSFAEQCKNPALTKQHILNWVLFNLLIFNSDAHAKNISFFVSKSGMSLAPLYDLVNIKMYPEFEHELAMGLGDEFDTNSIHAYQLADFADSCNLPRRLVATNLKLLIKSLSVALPNLKNLKINDDEREYVNKYITMVEARCEYLNVEAESITSVYL